MNRNRIAALALVGLVALLVSAAVAVAANGRSDRVTRCETRLAKAAERHGLSVAELGARVKARANARVDRALRAGRLSPERAEALRMRIAAAELCARAKVVRVGAVGRSLLRAAGAYLDLDRAELRAALPGTSLAALATAQGKSVDGLVAAMLARSEARLDRAVQAGRLTRARADRVLERLEARVDRLVQKVFPAG